MATLEVYRWDGDHVGVPIVEPMLSTVGLIYRGRAEMNANAQRLRRVEADVIYQPELGLGKLVALDDPIGAAPRRAKITGMAISFSGGRVDCALSLEEPIPDEAEP